MEWLDVMLDSVRGFLIQVGGFLPKLIGAVVILIVGWLLAKLLQTGTVRLLKLARFNTVTEMAGLETFLKRGGVKKTAIDIIGLLIYWLVILMTLLVAFNTLGLSAVAEMFNRIALFIPNVVVAVLILAIGLYLARLVSDTLIAYGKNVGIEDMEIIGRVTRYAIMAFVIIIALGQVKVGDAILVPAFLILFGAICLALALAFGLGGQKWAAGVLERFMEERKKK